MRWDTGAVYTCRGHGSLWEIMILPRYWVKEESEESPPEGERVLFAVWRRSETSLEEARARAWEAAERIAARIDAGSPLPERYAYGDRPAREEVIREHRRDDGSLTLAATRNVYGALVLNTARVMFIDVGIACPGGSARRRGPVTRSAAGASQHLRR